jgi:hypothetical protein
VGDRVVSLENSGGSSSCAVSFWAITIPQLACITMGCIVHSVQGQAVTSKDNE